MNCIYSFHILTKLIMHFSRSCDKTFKVEEQFPGVVDIISSPSDAIKIFSLVCICTETYFIIECSKSSFQNGHIMCSIFRGRVFFLFLFNRIVFRLRRYLKCFNVDNLQ